MATELEPASKAARESFVGRLAQFFPDAIPVRIPVRVAATEASGVRLLENTLIEFGTPNEVLFASALPLEVGGRVRLENSDNSLVADAIVVAVQYHEARKAVAARFAAQVSNWIIKS